MIIILLYIYIYRSSRKIYLNLNSGLSLSIKLKKNVISEKLNRKVCLMYYLTEVVTSCESRTIYLRASKCYGSNKTNSDLRDLS